MREITLPTNQIPEVSEKKQISKISPRKKWKYVLILSISTACILAATGLIIMFLAEIDAVERAELMSRIGTFLILFAAPLYFLAAHCLDKLDFTNKRK